MPAERAIPQPSIGPDTRPYWDAARAGRLLVGHCQACDRTHFYPRLHCPFCFSDHVDWPASSGRGIVYSFSILRRVAAPYCLAYVTLAEGPRMLSNIVDSELDRIRVGAPVHLVFRDSVDGQPVPMFALTG